ncbi:MAG: GDSL-type esterase/lipase family protein [Terrimicrobiaceae bacterium]|nr:GDSL-type esterase/lipase family protein [Terrimicrobiaceae bacterium]
MKTFALALLSFALVNSALIGDEADGPVPGSLNVGGTKVVFGEDAALLEAGLANGKPSNFQYEWKQVEGPAPAHIEASDKLRTKVMGLIPGRYVFSIRSEKSSQTIDEKMFVLDVRPAMPGREVMWNDPAIRIVGRFAEKSDRADLGWPGVTVKARFTGTSIRALLQAGWGAPPKFLVIVDGKVEPEVVVATDMRREVLLAEGLPPGEHELELVRLDGAWSGVAQFRGLVLEPDGRLLDLPAPATRRMEFYGDSITEGSFMPEFPFNNPYRAYAMTAARMLGADAHLIARGGIGIVRGYALPQTLPGVFDRAVPMGGKDMWDFSRWRPQVVVVNALQNDKWTLGKVPVEECIEAYANFLASLRKVHPDALLIATLGSMDAVGPQSPWPEYLERAVNLFKERTGDSNVDLLIFDHHGHRGHPNTSDAEDMARKLADHLRAKGEEIWH